MRERRAAKWRRTWAEWGAAYLCLLPALVVFLLFQVYPVFYAAWLSLLSWDGLSADRHFVGLDNYARLLDSQEFWNSLRVTVIYTAGVTLGGLAIGLSVALALNQRLTGREFYRTLYFTPVVTASVAAGIVWTYLFDPTSGIINQALQAVGIPGPNWLGNPNWALAAVTGVGIWKRLGFNVVIYLAGLQTIPVEYVDAAAVDGAGAWARFRYIIWPLLTPITVLLAIMSVIDAFQAFDHVFVMTFGGPMGGTDLLPLFLYREAFRLFRQGYAAAIGWVIFVVVFVFTLLQWRLSGFGGWQRS